MNETLMTWLAGILPNLVSIIVTCIVLFFAILVYCNPDTRAALRRQSLIMLLAVLVMSIFFNLSNIVGYLVFESSICSASVEITLVTANFQHFVVMLIAVNLQLTVVHHVSAAGFTLYYLIGSFIVSLIIVIPGAVAHIWGYDPVLDICWITTPDPEQRVLWIVGTAHVWTLLSAAVALCSTVVVLVKLALTSRRVRKTFWDSGVNSHVLAQQSILTSVTLRILPHPVFLVLSNVIVVIMDLNISINHWRGPIIYVMFALFYAIPPMFFALVVLFFDPSLSTAVQRLLGKRPTILGVTYTDPHVTYVHPIELSSRTQTNLPSASLGRSESDLERGDVQAGPSSKPTLYTSDLVEDGSDLVILHHPPKPPLPASGRRLGAILGTTDTASVQIAQSRLATMKGDNMDLATL